MDKLHLLQVGNYPEWDEIPLNEAFIVHRYFEASDKPAFLAEVGPYIRAIATRGDLGADAAIIDACPNLEIISVYGVGYDGVDMERCRQRGIHITNTPDVLTKDVADFGIAMMLCQARGLVGGQEWARSGRWAEKGMYPLQRRIWGRRAGILGLGRIGYEIARRLKGFEMTVAYCDVTEKTYANGLEYIADPVKLAEKSDFLFVTLAASAATLHIVNKDVIAALGSDGMLINISRASNVDEAALLNALENRTLGFAALDVFDNEPDINPRFLALDNVLVQPHHASGTVETRKIMGQLVRDNLHAYFAGMPLPTAVI